MIFILLDFIIIGKITATGEGNQVEFLGGF